MRRKTKNINFTVRLSCAETDQLKKFKTKLSVSYEDIFHIIITDAKLYDCEVFSREIILLKNQMLNVFAEYPLLDIPKCIKEVTCSTLSKKNDSGKMVRKTVGMNEKDMRKLKKYANKFECNKSEAFRRMLELYFIKEENNPQGELVQLEDCIRMLDEKGIPTNDLERGLDKLWMLV